MFAPGSVPSPPNGGVREVTTDGDSYATALERYVSERDSALWQTCARNRTVTTRALMTILNAYAAFCGHFFESQD